MGVLFWLSAGPAGTAAAAQVEAGASPGRLLAWIEGIVLGIEAVGILVIVGGGVVATGVFVYQLVHQQTFPCAYQRYREHLGQAILLGLEILVAADIIGTVAIDPTYENVGVLGLIVVIRTFLSVALAVEIDGRWPWERGASS